MAYGQPMTQPAPVADHVETEAERQSRIAWEAAGIAKARASVAAGYYATSAEVNAWIDSLGTDKPLPAPHPRHPRSR
jgi:predicted transcriptional regulator